MNNFNIIYKILKYLETAMDYDEADMNFISAEKFGISQNRWSSIIEMLAADGYIDGITIKRGAQGDIVLSVNTPRITLKGLEYLYENSAMKKAANIAKGIKDIIPGI